MSVPSKSSEANKAKIPYINTQKGFFNSSTIALNPEAVFEFFKSPANVEKVMADFPMGVENFLDLKFISATRSPGDTYSIKWENKKESKIQGELTFLLEKAPARRGTYLTAIAEFDKFSAKDKEPSDLMNIFLKRMKALAETGEIPTTKGQPSGRDELQTLH